MPAHYCHRAPRLLAAAVILFSHSVSISLGTLGVVFTHAFTTTSVVPTPSPCITLRHGAHHHHASSSLLFSSTAASTSEAASASEEESGIPAITERFLTLTENPNIAIVIDVENVRGKTGFELDHADLLDRLMVWTSLRNNAPGRTIAVVDHGSKSTAHLLHTTTTQTKKEAALCVNFAGPHVKADDIIARDVKWLLTSPDSTTQHVVVITADQELAWRCRSVTRKFLGPLEHENKLNSVMQKFAAGDDGVRKAGGHVKGGKGGKMKKKGGNKRSRAMRKRQYQQAVQGDEEEEEEEESTEDGEDDDAANVANNTTISTEEENEQQNSTVPTVEIIAPQRFLEDLEYALYEWLEQQEQDTLLLPETSKDDSQQTQTVSINNIPIPTPVTTLQTLFRLRGQILSLESTLRKKCTLHKRHTMTGELRKCKEEWKDILSSLDSADDEEHSLASSLAWSLSSTISSWNDDDDDNNATSQPPITPLPLPAGQTSMSWEKLTEAEQEKLLLRWGKRRGRHGTRREKTEDRIVLAERLRRQLELILDDSSAAAAAAVVAVADERANDEEEGGGGDGPFLVDVYAEYINSIRSNER